MDKHRTLAGPKTAILAGLALAGCIRTCESTPSSTVTTQGVRAQVRAVEDGSGVTLVTAELGVGGPLSNVFLSLDGDDRLVASRGTQSKPLMRRGDVLGRVWYEATLDPGPANAEIVVAFQRSIDQGAPDTRVHLPAAFEIDAPVRNATVSRSNADLVLRWTPAGGEEPMAVTLEGSCIETFTRVVEVDRGELAIPRGTLLSPRVRMQPVEPAGQGSSAPPPIEPTSPECRIKAVLTRQRAGRIDPRYGQGGHAVAEQTRATEFISVP